MKKYLMVLACSLFLCACQDNDAVDTDSNVESVEGSVVERNAEEEMNWILENNDDLHSPSGNYPRILDYNTGEPIGTSIYYDLIDDFDTNKYEMNIKVGDDYGRFVIGWDAPNIHTFTMENVTPVHSVSESRPDYIEMSNAMYDVLYDTENDGSAMDAWKDNAFVQITAADIDQDNALEFIVYAVAPNPETSWNDLHLEIYEYFPNQDNPFERVVQLTESVFSALPIKITPAGEIIVDVYRGDTAVVVVCKDGEWYVIGDLFKDNGEHSANYVKYTENFDLDFENAVQSAQNSWREQCREKVCEPKDFPALQADTSTLTEDVSDENASEEQQTTPNDEIEIEHLNGESIILQVYEPDDLADFIDDYVAKSVEAKNSGDFSILSGYIEEGSPVYKDMEKSVPATFKKGITMDHLDTVVEKIAADDSYVYFTVVNTFEIFNSTYDGPVSFRSVYKVFVMHDIVQVSELVSDEML